MTTSYIPLTSSTAPAASIPRADVNYPSTPKPQSPLTTVVAVAFVAVAALGVGGGLAWEALSKSHPTPIAVLHSVVAPPPDGAAAGSAPAGSISTDGGSVVYLGGDPGYIGEPGGSDLSAVPAVIAPSFIDAPGTPGAPGSAGAPGAPATPGVNGVPGSPGPTATPAPPPPPTAGGSKIPRKPLVNGTNEPKQTAGTPGAVGSIANKPAVNGSNEPTQKAGPGLLNGQTIQGPRVKVP
jgi:hypothetical protein